MATGREIEERLRFRILGLLHAGRLRSGERLPSIRQIAREEGADHRAVAEAYRALADQGLVEVRPGSGVYLASGRPGEAVLNETMSWIADLLVEGWRRRLGRDEVGELIARCSTARLRCACIESNEDHMTAIASELEEDFSLTVAPVLVDAAAGAPEPEGLRGADLVVATVFHAEAARAAADAAKRPFVLLTLDRDFTAEVDRRLREEPVTAVAVDARYIDRARAYFAVTSHRDRVRYALADRLEEEGIDPAAPGVMLTRAARRRLGLEDFHLLPPPWRVISGESARELCWTIVRLALRGMREREIPPPAEAGGGLLPR